SFTIHSRYLRKAVTCVCRDHRRRHSRLRFCLIDPDANSLEPLIALGPRPRAWPDLSSVRAPLRADVGRLRAEPGVGDGAPADDARLLTGDSRRDGVALLVDPEGPLPD